jgi:hypothetical protein
MRKARFTEEQMVAIIGRMLMQSYNRES